MDILDDPKALVDHLDNAARCLKYLLDWVPSIVHETPDWKRNDANVDGLSNYVENLRARLIESGHISLD